MPRYDCICTVCRMEFEGFALIQDRDRIACVRCGAPTRRVMKNAPGIAFKGQGWTRNESGWKSLKAEKAESDRNIAAFNDEQKAKAWETALNEARDWTDKDHADYEAGIKSLETAHGNARVANF